MELEIKRTHTGMKLTQAILKDMRPDEVIVAHCAPDAAAWKTAERIAYNVRSGHVRPDGLSYIISSCAADMSVTVSLTTF